MLAEKAEHPAVSEAAHRATFFRQSGWLMVANIGGGALMFAVHLLNKALPPGQYGSFGAFITVVMLLPTIPLQMIMTQQTAKALAMGHRGELSGLIRFVWAVTTGLWVVGALVLLVWQKDILAALKMTDLVGLWVTAFVVLLSLWMPMFWGALQGEQNFLWLGWSMLSNGIGRITVSVVAVLVLHAYAAGMMAGVLVGVTVAAAIGGWVTRSLWLEPSRPFDWPRLLRQVTPLMLGFLGFQILFTADTLFVKHYFSGAIVDFYLSAGTMSRALMWLVLPLATVMFPRLVQSAAKAQKTNLLGLVMLATVILAVAGAVGLSLVGPWVVKLAYSAQYVKVAASILPWYAGAMIPLALANVLLNNLLARPDSKLALAVCVIVLALGYMVALTRFHDSLVTVLQTLGIFNLALLAVCAWFTWGVGRSAKMEDRG
ncbi:MAG TPA: lipid II flippase MurJ [Candidatus Acidoferrum sp.]|jgi:O-antigen/teichoic acid export membrane protein|nr:lipid II flippase MurJ [Candidatus Acidoferrum sp.]